MPVSSAHLYSQMDFQDAAKQLQAEGGVAMPPLFSHTNVLWETEHSAHIVLSQNSVLSLVPQEKVRDAITIFLQTSDPSLKQMYYQIYNFPASNLKNTHICVCHILTPYFSYSQWMRFATFFPFPGTIKHKHIKSYFCTLDWTQPEGANSLA